MGFVKKPEFFLYRNALLSTLDLMTLEALGMARGLTNLQYPIAPKMAKMGAKATNDKSFVFNYSSPVSVVGASVCIAIGETDGKGVVSLARRRIAPLP